MARFRISCQWSSIWRCSLRLLGAESCDTWLRPTAERLMLIPPVLRRGTRRLRTAGLDAAGRAVAALRDQSRPHFRSSRRGRVPPRDRGRRPLAHDRTRALSLFDATTGDRQFRGSCRGFFRPHLPVKIAVQTARQGVVRTAGPRSARRKSVAVRCAPSTDEALDPRSPSTCFGLFDFNGPGSRRC